MRAGRAGCGTGSLGVEVTDKTDKGDRLVVQLAGSRSPRSP
ncbi:hypothetical protein [Oxynema aestuarii]|nr:hypothetical protein [Oxynema aestuarii]